jgi:hypothetical protein
MFPTTHLPKILDNNSKWHKLKYRVGSPVSRFAIALKCREGVLGGVKAWLKGMGTPPNRLSNAHF